MNKKIIMPVACVLTALALFVGCGKNSGEKEHHKAMAAWKDGDLARARALFEKSIRKTSGGEKKSTALNQLGLVLWDLGETAEAAEAFNKSCNLTEGLSGANLNLGVALYHAERYDEAEIELNNVLGEDPKNETALAVLGMVRIRQRDWPGALKELGKAATLDPHGPAALNALALAELHQGNNSAQAIKRLKALASARPDYAPAAFNLGGIHEHYLKDSNSAMSWYKQYLAQAGPDGSHVDAANRAVARLGGSAPSGQNTAPRHDTPAAARHLAAASKLAGQERYTEAIEQYKKAIAADPTQKGAYFYMARAHFAVEQYAKAAAAYEATLNLDPNSADAQYMLSLSYCKIRKWNDAERVAKELVPNDPARGDQMLKYISKARTR